MILTVLIFLCLGGSSLDIGYWESLLSQLKAHMARARLRDNHQELLKKKLYNLKLEQLGKTAVESQSNTVGAEVCICRAVTLGVFIYMGLL